MANLTNFSLSEIINPVSIDEFIKNYWEKQPLIVTERKSDYFSKLLSVDDVDEFLASGGHRFPSIRIVKDGLTVPTSNYAKNFTLGSDTVTGYVDPDKAFEQYANGATIVLQGLQRHWQPLAELCRNLEYFFTQPVQVNIYLTPKNAQGFSAHFDTHDVFVLQLAGTKRWQIYKSVVELPHSSQSRKIEETEIGEPLYDFDFKVGDLIYLPRGFGHAAQTSEDFSLHATIGVLSHTWYDVLMDAITACKEDLRFRYSLPIGFAHNLDDIGKEQFETLKLAILENLDLKTSTEKLAHRFISSRGAVATNRLQDLNQLSDLTLNGVVKQMFGTLYYLTEEENQISLVFQDKKVSFPDYVKSSLEFILNQNGHEFEVDKLPNVLDAAGKLVLVKRLVKEGFLTVVRSN